METAIVNEAKSPTRGSTPAMMENEMASGMRASATTRPARTSVRSIFGERSAAMTDGSVTGWAACVAGLDKNMLRSGVSRCGPLAA